MTDDPLPTREYAAMLEKQVADLEKVRTLFRETVREKDERITELEADVKFYTAKQERDCVHEWGQSFARCIKCGGWVDVASKGKL